MFLQFIIIFLDSKFLMEVIDMNVWEKRSLLPHLANCKASVFIGTIFLCLCYNSAMDQTCELLHSKRSSYHLTIKVVFTLKS